MKEKAQWLYRKLTRRARLRMLNTLRREGRVPVGILFYHRVADRHMNPWTISRRDFTRQLDWLEENFDVVGLEEARSRIQATYCDRPTISITFDDGYAENADFAIPELARRNLPATYFVATDYVRSRSYFPHDLQAGRPLEPNSIEDLRDFAAQGIEIGAHTQSHRDLGKLISKQEIRREVVGSAAELESWIGRRVRYFAFPFGLPQNTTQTAVEVIAEAGFEAFCTAYGAWNWPGSTGFHLRRIHADPGIENLKNWLTYDWRKLRDNASLPFVEPTRLRSEASPVANQAPRLHQDEPYACT